MVFREAQIAGSMQSEQVEHPVNGITFPDARLVNKIKFEFKFATWHKKLHTEH